MFNNKVLRNIINALLLVCFSSVAMADDHTSRFFGQWPAILPPLFAITFALIYKRVIPALFLALWLGAWLLRDLTLPGLGLGLLDTVHVFAREQVMQWLDAGRISNGHTLVTLQWLRIHGERLRGGGIDADVLLQIGERLRQVLLFDLIGLRPGDEQFQ